MTKPAIHIDGREFSTLEEFFEHVGEHLFSGRSWGRNLDAFDDVLRGGFGTPEAGFTLIWKASGVSRRRLGYPETVRQLEQRLKRCHPDNRSAVEAQLQTARSARGPTVFEWLVDIIRSHEEIKLNLE